MFKQLVNSHIIVNDMKSVYLHTLLSAKFSRNSPTFV